MKKLLIAVLMVLAGLVIATVLPEFSDVAWLGLLSFGIVLPQGFPGKAMFDTIQPGGEHAEDVSPLVTLFSPTEIPLLNFLGLDPTPVRNIRHEWLEDELVPDQDVLIVNLAANAADHDIAVLDASIYQINEIIQIGWETMQVTDVDETNNIIEVTRAYGENVVMAHVSGDTIILAGEASLEGDWAPDPQNTAKDRPFNITWISNNTLSLTGTRQASIPSLLGNVGDEWADEKRKKLISAMRDLEAQILFSDWNMPGGVVNIGPRRTMRGILNFLRFGARYSSGAVVPTPALCNRDVAAAAFTYDNWRQLQQQVVYNNGARNASLLIIPPELKVAVGKWKRTAQGLVTPTVTMDDKRISEIVGEIDTDFGRVTVVMVPRLSVLKGSPTNPAANTFPSILLCPNLVKPKAYTGRSFFLKDLGVGGDFDAKELIGEYGLEFQGVTKGWHSLAYNWTAI